MAEKDQIRNFIAAADAFRQKENGKNETQLQRHIKILFVVADLSVFSGDEQLTCDFYLSLHRLLSSLDTSSPITWLLLRLVERLCTNADALALIRDRYYFLPVVSNLLSAQSDEDQITLTLSVLQLLTAELTLDRYEPYARPLLRALADMVCGGGQHAQAALRVLTQLVRSGPLLPDSLLAAAHRRQLVKSLLEPEGGLLQQLYAAELMLALQQRRHPLPIQNLHSFISLVFSALGDGLNTSNTKLLSQANQLLTSVLADSAIESYPRLPQNIQLIVSQVTANKCHLAKFIIGPLEALVRRGVGNADTWLSASKLAASYMENADAVEASAGLLEALLHRQLLTPDGEPVSAALAGLQRFLAAVTPATRPVYVGQARAVVVLLNSIARHARSRSALAESWSPQLVRELLQPLPSWPAAQNGSCSVAAEVVVGTLELARTLGSESAQWLETQHELGCDTSVLAWTARALLAEERDLVQRALRVVSELSLPAESVERLSEYLTSQRRHGSGSGSGGSALAAAPSCGSAAPLVQRSPELSHVTAERVDDILSRLHTDATELKDPSLLDIMELYEFKVAAMTAQIADLEQALDAAASYSTATRLQLAQASAEGASVRRLLVAAERRVEALHAGGRAAEARAAALDTQLQRLRDERTQHEQQVAAQMASVQRLEREMSVASEKLRKSQQRTELLEAQRRKQETELAKLRQAAEEMRATMQQQAAALADRDTRLQEAAQQLQMQEQAAKKHLTELNSLELLCKSQEMSIAEKERDCQALMEENRSLRKIQEMIHSISSKGKGALNKVGDAE